MSRVEDFLTAAEESAIINAIREAEKNSSGEIRVHLERSADKDALERAKEVFYFLKMDETEAQNGVLFYVAVDDHKFSILGDAGINKVVPDNFWTGIKDSVIEHFSKGSYALGLEEGIRAAGDKLKQYFPLDSSDTNELSDEISLG